VGTRNEDSASVQALALAVEGVGGMGGSCEPVTELWTTVDYSGQMTVAELPQRQHTRGRL
jgi:hypothetical protein